MLLLARPAIGLGAKYRIHNCSDGHVTVQFTPTTRNKRREQGSVMSVPLS